MNDSTPTKVRFVTKTFSIVSQGLLIYFLWLACTLASRFRFDELWPCLLAILTTLGVYAGLLLSYCNHVDDPAEKKQMQKAARNALWATVMMAMGISAMGCYYAWFGVLLKTPPDYADTIAPENGWGFLGFLPVLPMIPAAVWGLHSAGMFLEHAARLSIRERSEVGGSAESANTASKISTKSD